MYLYIYIYIHTYIYIYREREVYRYKTIHNSPTAGTPNINIGISMWSMCIVIIIISSSSSSNSAMIIKRITDNTSMNVTVTVNNKISIGTSIL